MKGLEDSCAAKPQGACCREKTPATEPEPELYYLPPCRPPCSSFDRAEAHLDELKRRSPISAARSRTRTLLRAQGDTPGALGGGKGLRPKPRPPRQLYPSHRPCNGAGDHAQATLAEAQLGAPDALPQPLVSLLSEGKLRAAEQRGRSLGARPSTPRACDF